MLKKILLVLALLGSITSSCLAAPREYEIKAAFIYNFFRFIEWPTPRSNWVVGVLGDDPFEGGLREFESKPISGKKIAIKSLKTAKDAKGCDMVYISSSEAPRLDGVLVTLKGVPILTISDIPSFCDKGGAIGFTTERNRVRYIVNTDTLKQAELKANAKFLQLASKTVSTSTDNDDVTWFDPVSSEARMLFSIPRAEHIGLTYLALTR